MPSGSRARSTEAPVTVRTAEADKEIKAADSGAEMKPNDKRQFRNGEMIFQCVRLLLPSATYWQELSRKVNRRSKEGGLQCCLNRQIKCPKRSRLTMRSSL